MRRRRRPHEAPWVPPEEESGYAGSALLLVGDQSLAVTVHLDGHLEPLDGRFHWYGRIQRSAAVAAAKDAGATTAHLVIGDGTAAALRLGELDPWGHVQVSGTGPPPYPLEAVEVEVPLGQVSSASQASMSASARLRTSPGARLARKDIRASSAS